MPVGCLGGDLFPLPYGRRTPPLVAAPLPPARSAPRGRLLPPCGGGGARRQGAQVLPRAPAPRSQRARPRQPPPSAPPAPPPPRPQLQQPQPDRPRLRGRQLRLRQAVLPQRPQHQVRDRRQAQPHLVGPHGRATDPPGEQIQLLLLDPVLHVPPRTVFLLVHRLGRHGLRRQARDDQ